MVDPNPFWRARVGVIIPQLDHLTEPWLAEALPPGVTFHTSRMRRRGPVNLSSLQEMNTSFLDALQLLPLELLDLVVYHCTSGSMVYDPHKLVEDLERESGLPAVVTMQAAVDALRELELREITLVTPYPDDINQYEVSFLESREFTVRGVGGDNITDSAGMQRIGADEIALWVRRAHRRFGGDGIFLSCTGIRSLSYLDELEADLGIPIVTSGTATLWAALRRLGIPTSVEGAGRLLRPLETRQAAVTPSRDLPHV